MYCSAHSRVIRHVDRRYWALGVHTGFLLRNILASSALRCSTVVLAALLGSVTQSFAQTVALGLSSGTGSPGSTVVLDLSMSGAPASVEWTLTYPGVDFSSATVTAGPLAKAYNKNLSCNTSTGSATCLLWGDNNVAMDSGVAAVVSLVISTTTTDTSSQVQVSSPVAASSDAFALTSSATGGIVTIVQPAVLNGFSCVPVSITPPSVSTCTVDLTSGAPSGGASIGVTSSLPDVSFPATVLIAQGLTSGTFTVSPLTVSTATAVNLTASYLGASEGFGLTVNPPLITLTGISISPSTIQSGQSATGTADISAPALVGGLIVALSSSNIAAIVPTSVIVLQGATTAAFAVTAGTVGVTTPLVITGSYAGINSTANLTINPIVLTAVSVTPAAILSGQTASGSVTISAPATIGGVSVTLSSSSASLSVPPSVVVLQGATTAMFTATAGTVNATTPVVITGSAAGVNINANLTVNPIVPSALSLTPGAILSGQTSQGTVTIGSTAPTGGITVSLSSSNPAVTVPASVTVPQGATTATFTATAGIVSAATAVTLTASSGGVNVSSTLTVNPIVPTTITVVPASILSGQTSQGTVTTAAPAPAGGTVVMLSSSNAAASVPTSVTVLQGATTALFTATAGVVTSTTTVVLTASGGGVNISTNLSVNPIVPTSLSVNPTSILSGQTTQGTVTIAAPAPAGGMAIALSSSNAAVSVPASVTVAQGATSATFTATAGTVASITTAVLTASSSGTNVSASVTVNPIVPTSLSLSPTSVQGGQTTQGTVTISSPAPTGGITIALLSSNSAASVPASVTVPQGATTASFTATSGVVTAVTQVILTASYASVNLTATLTVNPPITVTAISLNPNTLTGGQTATATVTISEPAGNGGIVVMLTSSNTSAATVPASVTIPQGATTATFTVTALDLTRGTYVTITASYGGVQESARLTVHRYFAKQ